MGVEYSDQIKEYLEQLAQQENIFAYGNEIINQTKNWPGEHLDRLYKGLIQHSSMLIHLIPDFENNYSLHLELVKQDGLNLFQVPSPLQTPELIKVAINNSPRAIQFLTEDKQLEEYYLLALEKNPKIFPLIPLKKRTENLCVRATELDPQNRIHVPNEQFWISLIQQQPDKISIVPDDAKTASICNMIIGLGLSLSFVPVSLRNAFLCEHSVSKNAANLEFVPENLQSEKLILQAINNDPITIRYVSANHLTYRHCEIAVERDGSVFSLVPKEFQTEVLKRKATITSISQNIINNQIQRYLELKDRFKDDNSGVKILREGLCNGYSFLLNWYQEQGKKDYFYQTLALISSWDGSESQLEAALDKNLPQALYYSNLGELIEQWTNDIFASFSLESILPSTTQQTRHIQAALLNPNQEFLPTNLYFHCFVSPITQTIGWWENINHYLPYYKTTLSFNPPYVVESSQDPVIKKYTHQGELLPISDYDIALIQLNSLVASENPSFYINAAESLPFDVVITSYPEITSQEVVNFARGNEFLYYLSRLQNCYTDFITRKHSTTFHTTTNGLAFYNCNAAKGEVTLATSADLSQKILDDHGYFSIATSNLQENSPAMLRTVEMWNGLNLHTYTDQRRLELVRSRAIFSPEELPKDLADSEQFQQSSPNNFTHLHIAVITQSLPSLEKLLNDSNCQINALDCYGRTALSIALSNRFLPGIKLLFDHLSKNEPIDVLPHHIYFLMQNGQFDTLLFLLNHERVQIDSSIVAKIAIKLDAVAIFDCLVESKKINAAEWFQPAFFNNSLSILESMGALSINHQDELGNSLLHTAMYSYKYKERYLEDLLNNHSNLLDFKLKNHEGLDSLDLLLALINDVKRLSYPQARINTLKNCENLAQLLLPFLHAEDHHKRNYLNTLIFLFEEDNKELFALLLKMMPPSWMKEPFTYSQKNITLEQVLNEKSVIQDRPISASGHSFLNTKQLSSGSQLESKQEKNSSPGSYKKI